MNDGSRRFARYFIAGFVLVALLGACNTKKNTSFTRFYHSFNTRYNTYYNGKTNYDEQIKIMEDDYADDYTAATLYLHPAEAKANPKAPQPSGSFDRTIEKMQKAISLHSIKRRPVKNSSKMRDPKYREFINRDEFNPFIHNAWYLMAKSQYMKGDFLGAAATFHYITRHFTWLEELVTECKLWEARCYCAEGWLNEAENIVMRIKPEEVQKNKKLRTLYNFTYADYYVKNHQTAEAIPYLAEAIKGTGGGQKTRLYFLLGQLYAANGQKDLAYQAFKKAGSNPNSTYRTKFNARIKQSEVYAGADIEKEVRSLRSMVKYDRNKEYLDQVYYAIGNLYISRNDTVHAIENYKTAVEKSTRNGIEKALAQIALGGLYFDQHNYDDAQPCYAEAVPLLPTDYPQYDTLKRRSDVLDELAVYSQNVKLNDSLIVLAAKSPEEQLAVAQKLVDELKKQEKEAAEEAARQEYLAQQAAAGAQNSAANAAAKPAEYTLNTDNSWYFYNTATKNAGKTAFQKQWGNRKLEDDWRRRNKNTFDLDETSSFDSDADSIALGNDSTALATDSLTEEQKKQLEKENDPHFVEYYLKQIPKTEEEIITCHDIIQEGLFNMGVILKDKLEDYTAAATEFNTLLTRYPDNIYRLDVYYNMYLMYMRLRNPLEAERWRQLVLTGFPESKYGLAMQDPNYLENLRNMERDQEGMYQRAYDAYLADNNPAVHEAYAEMMRRYPLSKIMPKFMFIDALSYLTDKDYDKFKSTLKEMLERYPDTDITPMASSIISDLNRGRKLQGGSTNVRGMLWETRLTNDTTLAYNDSVAAAQFDDDTTKPQYLVVIYNVDSISTNQLIFDIARFNFNSFAVSDFDIEQMTFSQLGMVIVKGFKNFSELRNYRTVMERSRDFKLPKGARAVMISEANFTLLLREGRSFEEYFQYMDEKQAAKLEEQAIKAAEEQPQKYGDVILAPHPKPKVEKPDTVAATPDSLALRPDSLAQQPDSLALSPDSIAAAGEQAIGDKAEPTKPTPPAELIKPKQEKPAETKQEKPAETKGEKPAETIKPKQEKPAETKEEKPAETTKNSKPSKPDEPSPATPATPSTPSTPPADETPTDRRERQRLERERREQERAERREQERLEREQREKEREERRERQRLEQERREQERLETLRLEQERLEQERLEAERLEQQRLEAERLEKERLEKERLELERRRQDAEQAAQNGDAEAAEQAQELEEEEVAVEEEEVAVEVEEEVTVTEAEEEEVVIEEEEEVIVEEEEEIIEEEEEEVVIEEEEEEVVEEEEEEEEDYDPSTENPLEPNPMPGTTPVQPKDAQPQQRNNNSGNNRDNNQIELY